MKKEDLIAGETVLVSKDGKRCMYFGTNKEELIHFTSNYEGFDNVSYLPYTFKRLSEDYTIEKPESKVVPLEKRVYDFVPVRVRDSYSQEWIYGCKLIAVTENILYPFIAINEGDIANSYKQCEFIQCFL